MIDTDQYGTQLLAKRTPWGMMRHLVVWRHDGRGGIPWEDLQAVKDEILGPDVWAIEIYPPNVDIVDEVNRRHLWEVPEDIGEQYTILR